MTLEIVKERVLKISNGYDESKVSFLLDYTLGGGKEFRYKSYLHILKSLGGEMNEKNIITGYTIELLQAALLIVDDIMDNSKLRRGKPCYHLKRGMSTIKDAFFLLAIIRKFLNDDVREVYSRVLLRTCIGQTHDTLKKTRNEHNIETYKMICENKTGAYTLYLPAIFGYVSANKPIPVYLWEFCRVGALLFQMEDDYLNFLPEKSHKSMNDLEEKKCTWFSSKLALLDNKIVNTYFENGAVTEELFGIVRGFFGEYSKACDELLEKLNSMVREEDRKTLSIFIRFLESRKRFE